jgi:hypothetical protein
MVRYSKLTIPFRLLAILIGITFLGETIQWFTGKILKNSMFIEHITAEIEYVFFSLIYYYLFENRRIRKIIIYAIFLITILEIMNIIFLENLSQFPSNFLDISQLIYLIFSLAFFRQMLSHPSEINIFKQSIFWYNLDMLFFSAAIFLNFALTNYFLKNNLNQTFLYDLSYIINLIFYLIIGIAILIENKTDVKYKSIENE